jgi:hypothetical protein
MYYADRNYISSSLSSSSSVIVSIGGAATENSADPELIVSFGVCLVCLLPAQVSILDLEINPHFVCRVQEDPIVERASPFRGVPVSDSILKPFSVTLDCI